MTTYKIMKTISLKKSKRVGRIYVQRAAAEKALQRYLEKEKNIIRDLMSETRYSYDHWSECLTHVSNNKVYFRQNKKEICKKLLRIVPS